MSATAVRDRRQITLPEDISEAASLKVGDQVDWRFEQGEIRGRKLSHPPAEELGIEDLDPETLLPKEGKIIADSLIDSVRSGRDRQ